MVGEAVANGSWIGIAAVIAAIGSATATIIGALNARTNRRIEDKLGVVEKEVNGNNHPKEGE